MRSSETRVGRSIDRSIWSTTGDFRRRRGAACSIVAYPPQAVSVAYGRFRWPLVGYRPTSSCLVVAKHTSKRSGPAGSLVCVRERTVRIPPFRPTGAAATVRFGTVRYDAVRCVCARVRRRRRRNVVLRARPPWIGARGALRARARSPTVQRTLLCTGPTVTPAHAAHHFRIDFIYYIFISSLTHSLSLSLFLLGGGTRKTTAAQHFLKQGGRVVAALAYWRLDAHPPYFP